MINIDKYRVAVIITEYHIISKLILLKIIIPKFMTRQWFQDWPPETKTLILYLLVDHLTPPPSTHTHFWGKKVWKRFFPIYTPADLYPNPSGCVLLNFTLNEKEHQKIGGNNIKTIVRGGGWGFFSCQAV